MKAPDWLPPEPTMHLVAQAVAGVAHSNGSGPSAHPLWRGVLHQLEEAPAAERLPLLEQHLARLGASDNEIHSFEGALVTDDPTTSRGVLAARKLDITVLSRADLATLPDPKWLIKGHVPLNSSVCLYGPSGIGKSFLALSWLNCVATGISWFGHEVDQGPVAYVISEGAEGLKARQAAWEKHFYGGKMVRDIAFIAASLDLRKMEVPGLLLEALEPVLKMNPKAVVIDTLARNMGGNENDTETMGQLVKSVDQIWQQTGATALIVHHTGKDGQSERGNGSLRNAAHTMMKLTRDEENQILRLTCDKQRNASEFNPWTFHMQEIDLGFDSAGDPLSSCVLELDRSIADVNRLPPIQERLLEVLSWAMNKRGVSGTRLKEMTGVQDDSGKTAMFRGLNKLEKAQLITVTGEKQVQVYAITDRGRDMIWAIKRMSDTTEEADSFN